MIEQELFERYAHLMQCENLAYARSSYDQHEDIHIFYRDKVIALITNYNREKAVEAVNQLPDPFDYDDVIQAINKALGGSDE